MIQVSQRGGVAILTMAYGKVNALDLELCRALVEALDSAVAAGAGAVVLTGNGKIFSAGVDLHRVIAGGEAYVAEFLPELRRVFMRVAFFERPLVAAVNGHAIAGGFILFSAADWVVIANGEGQVGVTELLVGVPFPMVALELLRMRAGETAMRDIILHGSTFQTGPARERCLVDEVVSAEQLLERSLAAAKRLAGLGPAFDLTKRQLRLELEERIRRGSELDNEVDAIWRAPETLERIKSYMDGIARHHIAESGAARQKP
jgi:enoyl-CoA hydratase